MCIGLVLIGRSEEVPLIIAFNRDETIGRPTQAAHFWPDIPTLVGGRDVVRKGTWLAVNTNGRISFVTNFREPQYVGFMQRVLTYFPKPIQQLFEKLYGTRSRGELPVRFVTCNLPASQFLLKQKGLKHYSGCNMVMVDLVASFGSSVFVTNRPGHDQNMPLYFGKGLHVVSNGRITDKWPKMQRISDLMEATLARNGPMLISVDDVPYQRILDDVLSDTVLVSDPAQLPQTGLSVQQEQWLSSVFLPLGTLFGEWYGTRCQTVLAVSRSGQCRLVERSLVTEDGKPGKEWDVVEQNFEIKVCDST